MPPHNPRNRQRSGGARQPREEPSVPKGQIVFVPPAKGEQEHKLKLTNGSGVLPEKTVTKSSPVVLQSSQPPKQEKQQFRGSTANFELQ